MLQPWLFRALPLEALWLWKGCTNPALALRIRRGSVLHQDPLKGGGELHLPWKDTVKMIQKPREGSDDESIHTENRVLETVVTRAEGGLRDEIEGVPVPVGGAAPRKCLPGDWLHKAQGWIQGRVCAPDIALRLEEEKDKSAHKGYVFLEDFPPLHHEMLMLCLI